MIGKRRTSRWKRVVNKMAKEKKEKKKKKDNEEQAEGQKAQVKVPKESNPLLTVLTLLWVLVGLGEIALMLFIGISAYRGSLARQAYESQLAENPTQQTAPGSSKASYAGPWLMIENGEVIWRSENSPLGGVSQMQTGPALEGGTTDNPTQTSYPRPPSSPPSAWTRTSQPRNDTPTPA